MGPSGDVLIRCGEPRQPRAGVVGSFLPIRASDESRGDRVPSGSMWLASHGGDGDEIVITKVVSQSLKVANRGSPQFR